MLSTFLLVNCLIVHVYCNLQDECKTLNLPWGNYSATYDSTSQICFYENVRYAQAPTGSLRFQRPKTPDDGGTNPQGQVSCIQIDTSQPCTPGRQFGDSASCKHQAVEQEDCLFFDIYVPLSAFRAQQQLPVVVWFYGGAFVFGSKADFDLQRFPLYSGTGAIDAANDNLIFVAGNYRLGAFGWMAGTYMEAHGTPNAGLYDQRKILEFVNNYISNVNGDSSKVSVWGESAGASSILHHLIANFQPDKNPLFSRAIIQSPAFEWQWDRLGTLNQTYSNVSTLAGCPTADIGCLQGLSIDKLISVNQQYFEEFTPCNGLFPMGPSLDNKIITALPAVAFPQGDYYSGLESLIVSHVEDEVSINGKAPFIPPPIKEAPCDASKFDDFLSSFIPQKSLASLRQNISNHYPSRNYEDWNCLQGNQMTRVSNVIRDAVFTCNTRLLYDAYQVRSGVPTYMMQYSLFQKLGLAVHASDLLPTFWNSYVEYAKSLHACFNVDRFHAKMMAITLETFAPSYQSYFASHAVNGDPNTNAIRKAKAHNWQPASVSADNLTIKVVNANGLGSFFTDITDPTDSATNCDFWKCIAAAIQSGSGNEQDPGLMGQDGSVHGVNEL